MRCFHRVRAASGRTRSGAAQLLAVALAGAFVWGSTASAQPAGAPTSAVIELEHRVAADVAATLRPLFEDRLGIVAHGTQLIVSGRPADIDELRRLVQGVDAARVEYWLEVETRGSEHRTRWQLGTPTDAASQNRRQSSAQSLRVTAGETASIGTSETRPGDVRVLFGHGSPKNSVVVGQTRETAASMILVTPQPLPDGRVRLDLAVEEGRFENDTGTRRSAMTTRTAITAELGQWTTIATVEDESFREGTRVVLAGRGSGAAIGEQRGGATQTIRVRLRQTP